MLHGCILESCKSALIGVGHYPNLLSEYPLWSNRNDGFGSEQPVLYDA